VLTRSKAVLATLQLVGKPLGSVVLTKLVFLLRHEGELSSVAGFYDFVPYRFGPYSFALTHDLAALKRHGYAEENDNTWRVGRFVATDRDWIAELAPRIVKAIRFVLSKRGNLDRNQLLQHVYQEYPWFVSRSELKDLIPDNVPAARKAPSAVYTVGYQQRTVDAFLAGLMSDGIEAIIDVRSNPVSRNYGFAGRTLAALAEKVNLEYHHLPELGIPSNERKGLTSAAKYKTLFENYCETILPVQTIAVEKIVELVKDKPSALLCYEADPEYCHRRPLADVVAEKSGLAVIDLS